jgi:hypothetical protein
VHWQDGGQEVAVEAQAALPGVVVEVTMVKGAIEWSGTDSEEISGSESHSEGYSDDYETEWESEGWEGVA